MADFIPRYWDDNAITTYLKRYLDAEREVITARKRLERLEYQANKDKCYQTPKIKAAIKEDRNRISARISTAEKVKSEVLSMLDLLPDGDERRALELSYVAGMTVDDIEDALHVSRRTVFNLKDRGVAQLRKRIAEK